MCNFSIGNHVTILVAKTIGCNGYIQLLNGENRSTKSSGQDGGQA